MPLKNWCSTHARWLKSSLKHSIVAFFLSLKHNFIAYRSSKVSSRPDYIFEIHQPWQSGFSRVYSNVCCSCSFEAEIIKIGQSSHKMYSNKILNFQESTTILNAHTIKVWKLIVWTLALWRLFYTFISRDLVIFNHVQVFSCEISIVYRLQYLHNYFSSDFCFLIIVVPLIVVLFVFFLVTEISLLFVLSPNLCNVELILSSMLVSPLPPSFLDTYSPSFISVI